MAEFCTITGSIFSFEIRILLLYFTWIDPFFLIFAPGMFHSVRLHVAIYWPHTQGHVHVHLKKILVYDYNIILQTKLSASDNAPIRLSHCLQRLLFALNLIQACLPAPRPLKLSSTPPLSTIPWSPPSSFLPLTTIQLPPPHAVRSIDHCASRQHVSHSDRGKRGL